MTQMPAAKSCAAVVHEREAPGARALADLVGDRDLQRAVLAARAQRVELAVELGRLAGEQPGSLLASRVVEVGAGALCVLGGVEQGAVVDPHGVGVLVLQERPVHERAHVTQRLVVQVAAGHARGDRSGELRGDLVHVGELVGQRHGEPVVGGALGDAFADRFREGELAAQVMRALGADAEVGADSGDPVVVVEHRAGLPAVGELALLVDERELLVRLGLRLDAADDDAATGAGARASRAPGPSVP